MISVPIGVDINTRQTVDIKFASKDYLHGFILGQSGSGKSVLLNNIITSAILKYSPNDLMLYLMDFKGVEFNRYKGLKHTRAVLVDNSDIQMTLEILRELRDENKRRAKLFTQDGVQKIDDYNRRHPETKLQQILFIADECQVMFKENWSSSFQREIHREIKDITTFIATQGRSQGIHMLLATQQLDGADIPEQILKNLTECFLLMSAPDDSNKLVANSSDMTEKQPTGIACYYHKKTLQSQMQSFFAESEELADAISKAQSKAENYKGNGQAYFCGSDTFVMGNEQIVSLNSGKCKYPMALVGKNIGINNVTTSVILKEDYSENILLFGANGNDQTADTATNAFVSLIYSYQALNQPCDFLVIDCYDRDDAPYKRLLSSLEEMGFCHIIPRTKSGHTFKALADDIKNDCVTPVVLAIFGSERFIEMKKNLTINESVAGDIEPLGFDMSAFGNNQIDTDKMTFRSAFSYVLDEGPIHGVHVLLQVDKPANILFEGDYDITTFDKFRHKIILRSENKYIQSMRFSKDIDVEDLSDEVEHLRAYYYPEFGNPVLFTPFLLPDLEQLF